MLRSLLFFGLLALASPAVAQASAAAADMNGTDCVVRINATPTAWLIQGYDPWGGSLAEGTFSATFVNEGTTSCSFTPTMVLDRPRFGLSKGTGKPIAYALLNLTDSQDVTPRVSRSQQRPSQREIVLGPDEGRTLLYKLVADPDDVREAGTFTQEVILEAQNSQFRSFGGTRLVLGLEVLPSARIALTGAFSMNDGHAVVNLGELRQGPAQVPLQLRVNSTGRYDISVSSANAGRLRLGATEWHVPYSISIGGNAVKLSGTDTLAGPTGDGFRRDSLPIHFVIGETVGRRAGTYSDMLSIAVTAR